tara:strand:+ start:440 stop:688 length:249 start_codon:yes stop_codon:yes gene_type:complete
VQGVLKKGIYLFKTLGSNFLNKLKYHLIKVFVKRLDKINSSMAVFKVGFEKMNLGMQIGVYPECSIKDCHLKWTPYPKAKNP